jgi:hypothetical protein
VLYLDRHNPPKDLRRRSRNAEAAGLRRLEVVPLENPPPLSDWTAWKLFPVEATTC